MNDYNGRVSAKTSVFGLIGYPVKHSLSPSFWNAAFKSIGLDAVYVAFEVAPENIIVSLRGLQASGVCGLNITRPHKQLVAEKCDALYDAALDTHIVNTVKFSSQKIEGWNTDATGFLNLLYKLKITGRNVVILGNGATAKSVVWALAKFGIQNIKQIARKYKIDSTDNIILDNKKFFLRKIPWNTKNFTNSIVESDIIINTTPIGWHENDEILGFEESLNSSKCYIDFNYNLKSKLIISAKKHCGVVIDGRELLYEQGLEAFKCLTDYAPPAEVIRSIIFQDNILNS